MDVEPFIAIRDCGGYDDNNNNNNDDDDSPETNK